MACSIAMDNNRNVDEIVNDFRLMLSIRIAVDAASSHLANRILCSSPIIFKTLRVFRVAEKSKGLHWGRQDLTHVSEGPESCEVCNVTLRLVSK